MKPKTFSGVRHDMSAPTSEQDAIDKLDELNTFLGTVKASARLRAKDKEGITFLHTRTGTIFGRFFKWLTVGWPKAVQQRNEVKTLINNVLSKVECNNKNGKELKQKILDETLEVKKFSEFNIFKLRSELKSLQYLINNERETKEEDDYISPSLTTSETDQDKNDFHYEYEDIRKKPFEPKNKTPDDLEIASDYESENELLSILNSIPIEKDEKSLSSVPTVTNPLLHKTDVEQELDKESDTVNLDTASVEVTKPAAPEASDQLKDGSDSVLSGQSSSATVLPSMTNATIFSKPVETSTSAVEKTISSFGCHELNNKLDASSTHKIGTYHADAYILPSGADDLEFGLGTSHFESGKEVHDGIHYFAGTHSYHDETRNVKKLLITPIRNVEDGHLSVMTENEQAQYHQKLYNRYTHALNRAAMDGAKTVALKPLRNQMQLLTQQEIETLARAVKDFQRDHAEVNIQIVFTGPREVRTFNDKTASLL